MNLTPVGPALVLGLIGAVACSTPKKAFDSPAPAKRLEALTDPVLMKDRSTIPDRIRMLESDDPAVRMLAFRSLERMTGLTLGYDHAAPRAERRLAVDRWEVWWRTHQDASDTHPGAATETARPDEPRP